MSFQQQEIEDLINNCAGNIVITTHHKPDGDALGSSLGLWNYLVNLGKSAVVITPTDFPNFLDWMPGRDSVKIYKGDEENCKALIADAEIIFCLDFNDLKRINEMGDLVEKSAAKKVMIDHHQEPKDFADYTFHTINTSSTCELVFDFIDKSKTNNTIDAAMAACLYTGIMTDTGGFKHNSTKASTHFAAAKLIASGADHVKIAQHILDQFTLTRLKLIGYCLAEKLTLLEKGKVALITLSSEELKPFDVRTGDTEGLVNYGLSVAGVELAVLIIDRTEQVKMSFRSKNRFPCNIFAKENFDGGGHYNAAGGHSEETLENTIEKFKEKIGAYKQWL